MHRIFFLSQRGKQDETQVVVKLETLKMTHPSEQRITGLDETLRCHKQTPYFTHADAKLRRGEEMCPQSCNHHSSLQSQSELSISGTTNPLKPPKPRIWKAAQLMSKPQSSLQRPQRYEPKKKVSPASDPTSWRVTGHRRQDLLSFAGSEGLQVRYGVSQAEGNYNVTSITDPRGVSHGVTGSLAPENCHPHPSCGRMPGPRYPTRGNIFFLANHTH